ncbi:MAG: hypothetical protein PVS2B2_24760 [Candidatus Acidiferrum sp.]
MILVALVVAAQAGVSVMVRTHRLHSYLVEHLERAFGRPVDVGHFSVQLLPVPELDAERVTIGEDPAFGNEYFLRADHLRASLRWMGLLRGQFEFGTLSLVKPSLILTRSDAGKWNLEEWLPPGNETPGTNTHFYGPQPAPTRGNYLRKIDVDEGRINFKSGNEKLPFAFTGVTGSVEQLAPGRWQLRLQAQPWRSGVELQSTGVVNVVGDIAGTSARLRPAEITVHWDKVSLADLFRLVSGADFGVRGEFALDVTAKSGTAADKAIGAAGEPAEWTFDLAARGSRIHRWNLTDREDNPRVNVNMKGRWNAALGSLVAEEVKVETAKSNLRGAAKFSSAASPAWEWRVDSAGIQGADLLACSRAFYGGVQEGVSAEQFFTGAMTVAGWPVVLQNAAFSSTGGVLKIPGLEKTLRIGPVRGGESRENFVVEPVVVSMAGEPYRAVVNMRAPMQSLKRRVTVPGSENEIEVALKQNLASHSGLITLRGHVGEIADTLKIAAAFGQTLNHGWELKGGAVAAMRWEWSNTVGPGQWNGTVTLSGAELQAAGLNLPLRMDEVRLEWNDGKRAATIGKLDVLGANWSGEIAESRLPAGNSAPRWNFKLHADHLNATELDRWMGPRARPGWVENLLPSLFYGATPSAAPTELLRRVDAEGELRVDELSIERLKLVDVRAKMAMRDLHLDVQEAQAQWAGGNVRGTLHGIFSPVPKYEIAAELERVNLAQIPAGRLADRFAGIGSGTLQMNTRGVGREQLLQNLTARGKIRLKNPEYHGWDLTEHAEDGAPSSGTSRWEKGDGSFSVKEKSVVLDRLELDAMNLHMTVQGTVSFGREADLRIDTKVDKRGSAQTPQTFPSLKLNGPLDAPKITFESLQKKKAVQ